MLESLLGVGDLSPEKFVAFVVRIGIEQGVLDTPTIDVAGMRIVERDCVMHLHNVYASFRATPRRKRLELIRNYATSMKLDLPETWEAVRSRLRPVIRDGAYLALVPLQAARSAGSDAAMKPLAHAMLAPEIYATLVIDSEHAMAMVTESQLETWGVSFDEAREIAVANLRRDTTETAFRQIAEHVWVSRWNDSYAAARLLLPDIVQRVCTDPLVCIPNRDVLLVADARHGFPDLVAALAKVVEEQRYPISRRIFQLEHHALRAYVPPADAIADARYTYDRLYIEDRVQVYGQERELHEDDEDLFYAKLQAFVVGEREVKTVAAWTRGVSSLLPPVETIMFVDVDRPGEVWSVPWAAVQDTPGMLTRTASPLERWKTGEYPSAAWLAEHGEAE